MSAPTAAPNPMQHVMQVASGYIASSALYVVAELGIADQLRDGPRSAAEIAEATGSNANAVHRVLRLLVSLGIFEQAGDERYGLNAAARLLCRDTPGSLRGSVRFLPDPFHFRVYADLMHSVCTGEPAVEHALGKPVFEYLAENPEYSEIFNEAMTATSAAAAEASIEAYDFSRYPTIVDVGGGHGEVLMSIMRACPDSRGILADLGHVIEGARPRIAGAGLADRCQAVACDFFESVPEGGDAYVMKYIIHDWDDERASTILRNIGKAMGGNKGVVVLLEMVVPEGPEPHISKVIDLEMLAMPGGRERTAKEYGQLFERSGFTLSKIYPTNSYFSVIEAARK
jgi:hypothetical protein